jgi:hypothetical protein
VEYAVRLATEDPAGLPSEVRALAYLAMVGEPCPGDTVLLNVSALVKGLGTGGLALVVAVPDRLPPDVDGPGHIVKARYTPQQQMFLAIDEQDSPHHDALSDAVAAAGSLGSMPVVVADLHSALPAILAGIRADAPDLRVVYVMTDGGALPMAFSRSVAGLIDAGWLTSTITVGQAFGGEHEAVTLHSALVAARRVLAADIVVVTQGPGNVGTGTPWGFSGVAAGEALNAAWTLGGTGIGAVRVSFGDARGRHRGLSHHSRTAYGRVCLAPATLPYATPTNVAQELVAEQVHALAADATAPLRPVAVEAAGLRQALEAVPVGLSTMGRGLDADPEAFIASAIAGRWAASIRSCAPGTPE